jgi:hypothetical protein
MVTPAVAPHRRARWATLGAALALALTACGSATSSATDNPALGPGPSKATTEPAGGDHVKPATGPVLKAQGFSFHAPKGWADVTEHATTGVLLSAAHLADEEPLAITVRRVTPGAKTASTAHSKAKALLGRADATNIRVLPDTTIAGNPAAHVVGVQNLRGTHYQLDVFYVRTPHASWPLEFATNRWTTGDRRNAMLASVLKTCHWQNA